MTRELSVVSLFSGAGGFDWGFHVTPGFVVCLANELRAVPAETLTRNLNMRLVPTTACPRAEDQPLMIQGDVAEVSFSQLHGFEPHVLIGGPPCQDFSVIKGSQRKGVDVKRGKLYSHFVRAVTVLQPKVFVFENVPGLMSANSGQAYSIILEDFQKLTIRCHDIQQIAGVDNRQACSEKLGYEILFAGVVDASKLGVPQKRRRLIIVGLREDFASKLDLFRMQQIRSRFDHQMNGLERVTRKYPLTCIEVFEGQPLSELGNEYRDVMQSYKTLWEDPLTPVASVWKDEVWDKLTFDVLKDYLLLNAIDSRDRSEIDKAMSEHAEILKKLGYLGRPVDKLRPEDGTNILPVESDTIMERMWRIPPGENHEFVRGTAWEVEGRGISLIYRRPFPLKPAPTVVAYGGGGTWGYHYRRDRGKLTNRERARLQTFTDEFLFVGSSSEIRAQIGEAVPPLLAMKIAETLLEVLRGVE